MAATRRAYTGGAQSTTTTSAIASSGTTSFTITAYTGWPYGSDPFFVVVEPGTASEEKILVTRSGSTDTTVNIASDSERGQDGTSAVAHSSGSTVFPVFTALDADEANAVASVVTADTTNSRVGIGTASPARTLEVQSTSGAVANFESTASNAYITLTDSGTTSNTHVRVGAVGDDMRFYAGDAERVRIDSSGNVGINDTTPSYTLDVDGDINATGDLRIGGTAIGEWTSYTPVLTSTGTNPNLGSSGTEDGIYTVINDLVIVSFYLRFSGTGVSAGTGDYRISLPINADTGSPEGRINGIGWLFDSSLSTGYSALPYIATATTVGMYNAVGSSGLDVGATSPFSFTTSDQIRGQVIYKAA